LNPSEIFYSHNSNISSQLLKITTLQHRIFGANGIWNFAIEIFPNGKKINRKVFFNWVHVCVDCSNQGSFVKPHLGYAPLSMIGEVSRIFLYHRLFCLHQVRGNKQITAFWNVTAKWSWLWGDLRTETYRNVQYELSTTTLCTRRAMATCRKCTFPLKFGSIQQFRRRG